MRVGTAAFEAANAAASKHPRVTIEIASDTANTDLYYFTSHADCEVPIGTAADHIFYSSISLESMSGSSQRLDPINARSSIGSLTFTLNDADEVITTWLNARQEAGEGMRRKRVRVRLGFEGLLWADYMIPPAGTQLISRISVKKNGDHLFKCEDIQRSTVEDIFDPKETTLTSNITASATTITVGSTADLEMVYHGTSYTDSPSATVGYVLIDEEVIKYTGKTSTTVTGCTRGALNTKAVAHETDTTVDSARRKKVQEFIYLELPAPKLLLAILTGSLYGDSASLPSHWHLGIDSAYVATSQFTGIGLDLWDSSDDTSVVPARGLGLKKVKAKTFYEKELLLFMGCFMPVLADGQLGLKRMSRVLSKSPYLAIIDESNARTWGDLIHDMAGLRNRFRIEWNWDYIEEKFTRYDELIDQGSIDVHQDAPLMTMSYKLMHGATHTQMTSALKREGARDRYSGSPLLHDVTCLPSMNKMEIGDTVREILANVRDYNSGAGVGLDRTFEIHQARVNWITGQVRFSNFGSSRAADAISIATTSTVLNSAAYSTGHTELKAYLDGVYGTDVVATVSGSVLTLIGDPGDSNRFTLPGNASLAVGGNYYFAGDVILHADATLIPTQNVGLWVEGDFQRNGFIDGKGQGLAGATGGGGAAGSVGLGYTKAGGGLYVRKTYTHYASSVDSDVDGLNSAKTTIDSIELVNNTSSIGGLPTDLRGTSGGAGEDIVGDASATGGNGADGPAGLMIVCRNMYSGAGGGIDLSGEDGAAGGTVSIGGNKPTHAGSGAGSHPSGLVVILDGSSAVATGVLGSFTANLGNSPVIGDSIAYGKLYGFGYSVSRGGLRSQFVGFASEPRAENSYKKFFLGDDLTPVEDVSKETSKPTAISITPVAATLAGVNTTNLEISVTPPSDGNYRGTRIFIAQNGTDGWHDLGEVRGTDEVVFPNAYPGVTYEVRGFPISIDGVKSEDYATDTYAVGAALETVIAANHSLVSQADPATNGGVILDEFGLSNYDTSGNETFELDEATGDWWVGDLTTEIFLRLVVGTGVLDMGRDVQLRGSDAYNNENIYFRDFFQSLDAWQPLASSNGTYSVALGYLDLYVTGTGAEYARVNRGFSFTIADGTWSKNRRLKIKVFESGTQTSVTSYIGMGSKLTSLNGVMFKIVNRAVWAEVHNTSGSTSLDLSTTLGTTTRHLLEIEFLTATSAKFYIDGALKGTITTNLPTGTGAGWDSVNVAIDHSKTSSGSSEASRLTTSELLFLQEG